MILVLIQWDDSTFALQGWHCREEIEGVKTANSVSVGCLVKETDKEMVVALNVGSYGVADCIAIPKGCIKRVWKVKISKLLKGE